MARRQRKANTDHRRRSDDAAQPIAGVRIIGGRFRGRRLEYSGDLRTRPMKDRLREAIFNLVGPAIEGQHAIDLFAGTGALGFESLSRGARRATLIEQHRPTTELIRRNATVLGVEDRAEIIAANTFVWWQRKSRSRTSQDVCEDKPAEPHVGPEEYISEPWVVFCSPPYDFYIDRAAEMLTLIGEMMQAAKPESVFVVEADGRMDFRQLPEPEAWDVRSYPPAVVGIYRKG